MNGDSSCLLLSYVMRILLLEYHFQPTDWPHSPPAWRLLHVSRGVIFDLTWLDKYDLALA